LSKKEEDKPVETLKMQEEPFRTGEAHKEVFVSNCQTYFDTDIKKQ
jgi:hypothetical protein